jgi:hypothetical protein
MNADCWNVISAGASREHLTQNDLLPGPVVTVNRAVDVMDRGIGVDFAAFADLPEALEKVLDLDHYLRPPIQVWVPRESMVNIGGAMQVHSPAYWWEPRLSASVGMRLMPVGVLEDFDGSKRHIFCLMAAIERVCMFRPKKIRVLCADMMGSWSSGMTEEECQMHQSHLEEFRRHLSEAQKRVNATRGEDQVSVLQRNNYQAAVAELQKKGDPGIFRRWEYERKHLNEHRERAKQEGIEIEYKSPSAAVMA